MKPTIKFNNGNGAILCTNCSATIKVNLTKTDYEQCKVLFCKECLQISHEQLTTAILEIARHIDKYDNYMAILTLSVTGFPKLCELIIFDMFLYQVSPKLLTIRDHYKTILIYSQQLHTEGYFTFYNGDKTENT